MLLKLLDRAGALQSSASQKLASTYPVSIAYIYLRVSDTRLGNVGAGQLPTAHISSLVIRGQAYILRLRETYQGLPGLQAQRQKPCGLSRPRRRSHCVHNRFVR